MWSIFDTGDIVVGLEVLDAKTRVSGEPMQMLFERLAQEAAGSELKAKPPTTQWVKTTGAPHGMTSDTPRQDGLRGGTPSEPVVHPRARYRFGMRRQVTVRLPDDLVQFIDGRVERGDASGRAAVVAAALERERRREVAERDARILARAREKDDLDELAAFAARTNLDDPA